LSFLRFEQANNSLAQCAGWQFAPSSGHVHNFRPAPENGLVYNNSVERFVHDRDGDYPPSPESGHNPGFDYFIGGRINGSPTQGYAAYLAGHKYAKCSTSGSTELDLEIRLAESVGANGYLEITLHTAGGQSLNARFDVNEQLSSSTPSARLEASRIEGGQISIEFADANWQEQRILKGVVIRNSTEQSLAVESVNISYPPQTTNRLIELNDRNRLFDPDQEQLCTDRSENPAICALDGSLPSTPTAERVSRCSPVWEESNTCGMRYVLNTVLGLQFTLAPHEYVTTSPIIDDGVLYTASFEQPQQKGHLRATDVTGTFPQRLWNAGELIPLAGTDQDPGRLASSDPPTVITPDNQVRTIFTTRSAAHHFAFQEFSAATAHELRQDLDVQTVAEAQALINTVRGRRGASTTLVEGLDDLPHRLWGISRSTPAVVGASSQVSPAENRDKVVYVGAEDGMLHAFYAGHLESGERHYTLDDEAAGKELWAYIPHSLLPHLNGQPFNDPNRAAIVHVDGSPAVGDFFVDLNDDGQPEWRTLLVGTASIQSLNQGIVFTLDVSEPYDPKVLWERTFEELNLGNARGVAIGSVRTGDTLRNNIYLTSSFAEKTGADGVADALNGQYGIQATALDLLTGEPLWHFFNRYQDGAANVNASPAIPALLDADDNGSIDLIVFGDMAGRLWAISGDGEPLGSGPIYTVPGGETAPIGSSVALTGRTAVFGTGGTDHATDDQTYAIYAVKIRAGDGQLLWTHPLEAGEKVWGTPTIDQAGQVFFGTATGYRAQHDPTEQSTSGRLVVLDKTGSEISSTATSGAVLGNIEVAPGIVVAVSLTGEVNQLGVARRKDSAEQNQQPPLKVFSWRAP
jgi:outer membrane protein assembly factor BamB